jgi:excisionase family DNA binding protein
MPDKEFLSTIEVAAILKVSRRYVNALITRGLLKASQIGSIHLVHRDDLADYQRRKRGPGRPRQKRAYHRR